MKSAEGEPFPMTNPPIANLDEAETPELAALKRETTKLRQTRLELKASTERLRLLNATFSDTYSTPQ